jgi:transcriptional regulator with XRE-family HTH domain
LVYVIELGYIPFYLDVCMSFANVLKHTMTEFGLTGAELAEKSGVSKNTVSAFRQGRQSLSVDNLEKLLGAMPREARMYFFDELKSAEYKPSTDNMSPA